MKNQSVLVVSIISIAIGITVGYAFGNGTFGGASSLAGEQKPKGEVMSNMEGMHMMPDGTMMKNGSSMQMPAMDHSAMMVKSEQEFVEGMIPHHQEAVDTAKEVIARGGSTPEIKKLAQDIVIAQEKEVAMMKQWYKSWYGRSYVDTGSYEPMMRDLSALKGAALDRIFLEDMEMHHMGAIMMAESVEPYIKHAEVADLAREIIETQTEEIELMRELAKDLK
jgi:uncharacterized protein (DUF305 family)